MRKKLFPVLVLAVLLVLSACGEEPKTSEQETKKSPTIEKYLYDSESVKVTETSGWNLKTDSTTEEKVNVVFENGKLNAIVSVISNDKSLDEIKQEIKASYGQIEIMEETDTFISFLTNRKESLRADIYLTRGEQNTGILIFMTPAQQFEEKKDIMEEFQGNVQYF